MLVIVTYDVSTTDPDGGRRLRNVAKTCIAYGQRVQNSVFECSVTEAQLRELEHSLKQVIDKEHDSIRFSICAVEIRCSYS